MNILIIYKSNQTNGWKLLLTTTQHIVLSFIISLNVYCKIVSVRARKEGEGVITVQFFLHLKLFISINIHVFMLI